MPEASPPSPLPMMTTRRRESDVLFDVIADVLVFPLVAVAQGVGLFAQAAKPPQLLLIHGSPYLYIYGPAVEVVGLLAQHVACAVENHGQDVEAQLAGEIEGSLVEAPNAAVG